MLSIVCLGQSQSLSDGHLTGGGVPFERLLSISGHPDWSRLQSIHQRLECIVTFFSYICTFLLLLVPNASGAALLGKYQIERGKNYASPKKLLSSVTYWWFLPGANKFLAVFSNVYLCSTDGRTRNLSICTHDFKGVTARVQPTIPRSK